MDGDLDDWFFLWCAYKDDETILECINNGAAFRCLGDLFESACRWNRGVIVKRLLEFPLIKLLKNTGFTVACENNALTVVNCMLNLPELDLGREDWECLRVALDTKNKTTATRLLQDVRIPKNELVRRWAYVPPGAVGPALWFPGKQHVTELVSLLRSSRLRMMVMYSKGFGRMSGLPKELVHLISSYTEPYHIKELEQFALFIEKIETTRDVVPFNQQGGSPGI
jgi:hypothetical protein